MSSDLERALSKLRFDDQVIGYSLMTKAGRPFVSFAFPDDLFPRIKDSIGLYKTDLRLMTIDTEKGLVVLSPVDENWILTVLYVPELQLGLAIAKTKNVLRLLEGIELPPPPEEFEESAESNLQVLESIAIKAASTEAEPESPIADSVQPEPIAPAPKAELSPDDYNVLPSTIPNRGSEYSTALSLDSDLYQQMKKQYRNFGFDVLMLVNGELSVEQIADSMFQSNDRVIDLLRWAASKEIVEVPKIKVVSTEAAETPSTGRFIKCPRFEGDVSKVNEQHLPIIQLCDGSKTTEEIAKAAGVAEAKVIQIVARYRKDGMRIIGKSV
jgi:hypothetical protein